MIEAEAVLGLEAPALRAHLERRDARRVVDEDVRRREVGVGAGQARPVLLLQVAGAQPVRVDPRVRAEHAQHQLLLGHLEREDADRLAALERGVLRDVEAERRSSPSRGGRPGSRGRPSAGRRSSRRGPRSPVARPVTSSFDWESWSMVRKLSLTISRTSTKPWRMRRSAMSKIDFSARSSSTAASSSASYADCTMRLPAWIRFRRTDFSLMMRAQCSTFVQAREPVEEGREVGGAADRLERRAARQLVLQRDEVDRLAALGQHAHRLEDAAVRLAGEVVAREQLGGGVEGRVVHQHGAQHGALGFGVLRKDAVFEDGFGRQGTPPREGVSLQAAGARVNRREDERRARLRPLRLIVSAR